MKDLRGKNAVLTGASRGLGPFIARALAQKGVNLALTARTADAVEATAKEATALGVNAIALPLDITEPAGRQRLLEGAVAANGPIDILINNAGIEWVCKYTTMSAEQIEQMIQTNLIAPLILSRLVLPEMIARGSGHVVMMSSLGGKKGSPYSATYAATKSGLRLRRRDVRRVRKKRAEDCRREHAGSCCRRGSAFDRGRRRGDRGQPWAQSLVGCSERHQPWGRVVGPPTLRSLRVLSSTGRRQSGLGRFGVYEFYRQQAEDNQA
ncbi:MAG: SDR family oxidoreductase [Deltaproteobacteria bacterium]|nr:SDR family oxidoreductase [Deltaproteobacteria bacterium]